MTTSSTPDDGTQPLPVAEPARVEPERAEPARAEPARVEPATPALGTPVTWDGPARPSAGAVHTAGGSGLDVTVAQRPLAEAPGSASSDARPSGGSSVRLAPRLAALTIFAVFATALAFCARIFLGTADGQRFDELALLGSEHGSGTLWRVAEPVLDVVSVAFIAIAVIIVLAIAAMRRAWGLGLQVAVLVVGANITTQLLKRDLLERAELGVLTQRPGNSFPSGHTTVAASVAIALLLVVPRRARPYVALIGGAWTAATGASTLVGQWHRPSDVVAALLVVGAWTGLVVAFTPRSAVDRSVAGTISTTSAVVVLGLGALLGAGFVALTVGVGFGVPGLAADDVRAYAASLAAVVGLTCVLFLVTLLLRQAAARRRH
ncbi:phosphatase PAP2 family protein [Sanguibacter sp. A247]|uniref:phosphatase PAP2 family protein n=1 Tax=unclassified Sanguibacter TaxID=2645534 RepID=UPI003FD70881